jgi:hypothetical protein
MSKNGWEFNGGPSSVIPIIMSLLSVTVSAYLVWETQRTEVKPIMIEPLELKVDKNLYIIQSKSGCAIKVDGYDSLGKKLAAQYAIKCEDLAIHVSGDGQ